MDIRRARKRRQEIADFMRAWKAKRVSQSSQERTIMENEPSGQFEPPGVDPANGGSTDGMGDAMWGTRTSNVRVRRCCSNKDFEE